MTDVKELCMFYQIILLLLLLLIGHHINCDSLYQWFEDIFFIIIDFKSR